jgi:hypothetical protein
VRTTISLPDELLQNAKALAAQRTVTLGAVIEDALRAHLAGKKPSRQLEFRLYTVKGRLVNPHLNLDRTSALTALEDELDFASTK